MRGAAPPKRKDEVGLSLSLSVKQTLTLPNERLTGRISVVGGHNSRFATMMLTTCGDRHTQVPPALIFKGKGHLGFLLRNKLNSKAKSSGVHFTFQEKAWVDKERLCWWFQNVFKPMKNEKVGEANWALLLLDSCGTTHRVPEFKDLCAANKVLAWYGEPNLTDSWQPIDASIGKTTRNLLLGNKFGLGAWLEHSRENRRKWTKSKLDSQLRRLMCMQFLGKAWQTIHTDTYERMHANAWVKTGCLLTADGTDDDKVQPQGLADYVVHP